MATPAGGRWSHPSESRSQKAAVRLTPSDLPFPSLPVAWLLLPPGSHHNQLPMCCCDLNSGSRKKLTIPRLVAHCAEPPHQLESSSLLHPDAQTVCVPGACLVLRETLSLRRISGGTASSGFRERHQEGGKPGYVWHIHLLRRACFWKLSFYSEVIVSTGKQRKGGRFAKWLHVINKAPQICALSIVSHAGPFISVLGALLCNSFHSGSPALGSSFTSRAARVFSHGSCFIVHCASHLCIFLCFSLCWGGTHPPQTFLLSLPVTVVAAQLKI